MSIDRAAQVDVPGGLRRFGYTSGMCGRYVSPEEAELNREYLIDRRNADVQIGKLLIEGYRRNYNVAPTHDVPVVRAVREKDGKREIVALHWGLIPFWSKGIPPKFSSINATIEKLEAGPTWRGPWKRGQRCVIPCSGFYEWHVNSNGSKTPFYIRPSGDDELFSLAGLWDASAKEDGTVVESCTIITMPPNELMKRIHNAKQRMPAVLEKEDVETWLTGTPEQARAVLKQYPPELMRAHTVARAVGSPRNNRPELLQPILDPECELVPA